MKLPKEYYHYRVQHGESGTVYTVYFVDNEDTVDMFSWNAKEDGLYKAEDFCKRHNQDPPENRLRRSKKGYSARSL